ncbi:MAG: hypothetical protein Q9M36_12155 [Sulfurovum sp.]|nr:hypothetical protein [Sulfurovum sp.]
MHIFLDIIVDILIAMLLFVSLSLALYGAINLSNIYLIQEEALFIPIEDYKALLFNGEYFHAEVLWITLMFLSTLLPTLLHFVLFVYALVQFILVKPHLHELVKELETLELDNHHKKDVVASALAKYRLSTWLHFHLWGATLLGIAIFILSSIVMFQFIL